MSETKDTGESTTQLRTGRTLRLRPRVEAGQVRQNFSHGRSKPVVVEKRRKRTIGRDATETAATPTPSQPQQPIPVAQPRRAEQPSDQRAPDQGARPGVVLRTLTEEERDARSQALAEARIREAEERRRAEEEAKRRAEIDERERREREAEEARRAEEERQRKAAEAQSAGPADIDEAVADQRQQGVASAAPASAPAADDRRPAAKPAAPVPASPKVAEIAEDDEEARGRGKLKRDVKAPVRTKSDAERRRGRLTIGN